MAAVVDEVGTIPKGAASLGTCPLITISEFFPKVELGFPVMEMSLNPSLFTK